MTRKRDLVALTIDATTATVTEFATVLGFGLPLVTGLYNTKHDGNEQAAPETASTVLCGGAPKKRVRCKDSSETVTAVEAGRAGEFGRHDLSEMRRIRQVRPLAQRYCTDSDGHLKPLTPTIHD